MTKVIQPLSDPDDIREEANEQVKEKFTDYYVDAPAPDPLDFHPPAAAAAAQPDPAQTVADDSLANDPLTHVQVAPQPTAAQQDAAATAASAQANDPLRDTTADPLGGAKDSVQ